MSGGRFQFPFLDGGVFRVHWMASEQSAIASSRSPFSCGRTGGSDRRPPVSAPHGIASDKVVDGLVQFPFPHVGVSLTPAVSDSLSRIEPDRFREIGDGFVLTRRWLPSVTAADVDLRAFGIDPQGFVEVGNGLVRVALFIRATPRTT